ncbi:hypothetical protein GV792_04870 [Nocardia cyriacigeorgica]|uniref:hypothetical protein n=1 Tax=Nocardia cyriacigeorgica TaxID=135487 RepID=UPI0013B5B0B4|nr:hypothetical protein [Nocardia cyriacigeorgica]NEW49376.1 hypothetical protein [Nocardia cyriacigeorgica]
MSAPIVFLDTETDGVHPGRKVWEIAMIRRDEHGERELSMFLDINLSTADPFGLKVGRFYDRHPFGQYLAGATDSAHVDPWHPGGAVDPGYAADVVARWTHGAHIVGAVPNFDTEVLAAMLREHGLTPAWHYHLIDIEALMVGWLHGAAAPAKAVMPQSVREVLGLPWKSDDLTAAIGVEPTPEAERHTALGDARWAMRVYDAIVGGAS